MVIRVPTDREAGGEAVPAVGGLSVLEPTAWATHPNARMRWDGRNCRLKRSIAACGGKELARRRARKAEMDALADL